MSRDELRILRDGTRYIVGFHQSNGDTSYFERAAEGMPAGWGVASVASNRLPLADVPESLDALALRYRETMSQVLAGAPVVLGGWGLGGLLALACATSDATPHPVLGLFALETKIPEAAWSQRPNDLDTLSRVLVEHRAKWRGREAPAVRSEDDPVERVRGGLAALGDAVTTEQAEHELLLFQKHVRGIQNFRARPFTVPCVLVAGEEAHHDLGWSPIAPHAIHRSLPGNHYTIASPSNQANLATAAMQLIELVA